MPGSQGALSLYFSRQQHLMNCVDAATRQAEQLYSYIYSKHGEGTDQLPEKAEAALAPLLWILPSFKFVAALGVGNVGNVGNVMKTTANELI